MVKSTLLNSFHGLHTWVTDDKTPPPTQPPGKNMPNPKNYSPPADLTNGIAKVAGMVSYGILAFSFLVALVCTGMIWKAHKDGGQASFVGLGMAMLTVIVSGSLATIFNYIT
ncbi:hypothetical protein B4N89_44455 [Embleya scabrispora]|uniref:Uncharacterized protein n=1 Tax=Embleya scabrispora TaxID=159449 RepID=A0A1T3NKY4_9ACTN|nr:hypothetical protein [Embleya scabrispora]OPC77543.1 hypothetical protein B4N89_44455 [Embleya scabrispora]